MGGFRFSTPVRLLRLGGCDMVLAVDVLCQFGKITLDFNDYTVQFRVKRRAVTLQGIQPGIRLSLVTADQWEREMSREGRGSGAFLCVISS